MRSPWNIHFINTILQISNYSKIFKEELTKQRKLPEHETIALSEESSAILQYKLLPKLKDLGSFILPFFIGDSQNINILIDSRTSINLITLNVYKKKD